MAVTTREVIPEAQKAPIVYRPDTGCSCVPVETPEALERLTESVKNALEMGILDCEKPSLAFAMLLLGGQVVYCSTSKA
ncbi:uncharacterized protein F4822DRAFT_431391 [Hypoxylon trugodes]|uniref:uncharacterized protein n=1 Tax=Hypoxylon trugodes TaxID=326681 RepID=UPI0021A0F340|nr:uncharacterized protein F4822DRAFT_431391 [Hypoxylon trugodes]KAI1386519.1 hypothetical protein F4822DRAFT_431391 [Hypoxylon trugodes]